jgi:putative flippase GtrA
VVRFAFVGGANTLATTAAFYVLATVVPATVAFTIVYVVGLCVVTVVTPGYVFGSSASGRRRALLASWYVLMYVTGIAVVTFLQTALSAPRIAVVLGTVCVTAPLGFLGSRLIVTRQC